MTSENETVSDIVKRVRRDCNSYPLPTAAAEMLRLVREMDAAHQREVAELKKELDEWKSNCNFNHSDRKKKHKQIEELRKGISELLDALQTIYDEECTGYGTVEVYDKWRKSLKGASND